MLKSLQHSDVIIGNINTRFRDPVHQAGQAGPGDRLRVMTDFLTQTRMQNLKPPMGEGKLTVDHAFAQPGQKVQLRLVSNGQTKIDTDYILYLTFGEEKGVQERLPDL
jgi:hypothetical protein